MNRSFRLLTSISISTLLLAGCSTYSTTRSGMMGSNTNYYSSTLACKVPTDLTGTIVRVTLGDMGMNRMMGGVAPRSAHMRLRINATTIQHGTISVIVINSGWRTHELVIMPLTSNQDAGKRVIGADGKVDETGSLGEASNNCGAGVGEGIKSSSASWVTLKLNPGRYEFMCNLKNHYADGMFQELVVS